MCNICSCDTSQSRNSNAEGGVLLCYRSLENSLSSNVFENMIIAPRFTPFSMQSLSWSDAHNLSLRLNWRFEWNSWISWHEIKHMFSVRVLLKRAFSSNIYWLNTNIWLQNNHFDWAIFNVIRTNLLADIGIFQSNIYESMMKSTTQNWQLLKKLTNQHFRIKIFIPNQFFKKSFVRSGWLQSLNQSNVSKFRFYCI